MSPVASHRSSVAAVAVLRPRAAVHAARRAARRRPQPRQVRGEVADAPRAARAADRVLDEVVEHLPVREGDEGGGVF
eukprot:gene3251-biopygen9985